MTEVLPADEKTLRRAAARLRAGDLVAFPTETVYGLGARADSSDGVDRIFALKGRPSTNPVIVHVADVDAIAPLVAGDVPPLALALAERFWPGPLTVVLPVRAGAVASAVTAGGATIGLRVPAHPVALSLLREAGVPIAAPSANPSCRTSPTQAIHVQRGFPDADLLVVDGGPTEVGIESTVIRLAGPTALTLLRHGGVPVEALAELADVLDATRGGHDTDEPQAAPGRMRVHYAPVAPLRVVDPRQLNQAVESATASGKRVAVIAMSDVVRATRPEHPIARDRVDWFGLPRDARSYAAQLYAALHEADEARCDLIVVEEPPDAAGWQAVRDRLRRAAAASDGEGR